MTAGVLDGLVSGGCQPLIWGTVGVGSRGGRFGGTATSHTLTLLETARLLAMGNIVGADTQIACWNAKYHYGFWRPVTAVAQPGRDDGNPSTVKDPAWAPTVVTPNHPGTPPRTAA